MQKLITVSVDTNLLMEAPGNAFAINEVEAVNELLELGWEIEEWDFLKEDAGDGKILLLVTLNDDAVYEMGVNGFDDEFDFESDGDEEEEDDVEDARRR